MANRDDQHLRQLFSQKFEHYQVHLPDDDWEMLMAKQQIVQRRRRRAFIVRWVAAASFVSLLIGGFSSLFFHSNVRPPVVSTISTPTIKNELHSQHSMIISPQSMRKKSLALTSAGEKLSESSVQSGATTSESSHPADLAALEQSANIPLRPAAQTLCLSSVGTIQQLTNDVVEALNADFPEMASTAQDTMALMKQLENLPELPALADQSHANVTSSRHLSAGWLALHVQGNNGLPTGFNNSNAWTQPATLDYRLLTQVSRNVVPLRHSTSSSSQMITFIDKKTYAFPISWGITFSQPFYARWEFQTGLSFTQLVTTGEVTSTLSNRATGRIEQDYLGIPLKVAYSFVEQPSFSLYVSGGGGIEKGVSLVEKIYNYNSQNAAVLQDSYSTGIHGFQFSLDANVGATYRLYKFLFIYMETGGAYFIPCDQPESYRTVHPLGVSLKFGIQFKLYHK
ncbi:MAG: outer membrane beta-barrel protein [Microbacter sp.]